MGEFKKHTSLSLALVLGFSFVLSHAQSAASKVPTLEATQKLGEQPDKGPADAGTTKKIPQFNGQRNPGFSPIELEIERTADGRLRVKSVDPDSPYFGLVKKDDVFNSIEDLPQPKH